MKKLKSLKWYDGRPGFDGGIRQSTGVDDIFVCGTRIYIRYGISAGTSRENGTDDGTFHIFIQFSSSNHVHETVHSLEEGKTRCEELREEFWNKLYEEIERMFV